MANPVKLISRIPAIVAEAEAKAALVCEKTARDIQAGCVERSRVDTGQMQEGWEVEEISATNFLVYNSVEHVIHNEYGTESMPAQPMLTPSVEAAEPEFHAAMGLVYS